MHNLRHSAAFEEERPSVFLAENTKDVGSEREQIKRELELLGFDVLPKRKLSLDYDKLQEQMLYTN